MELKELTEKVIEIFEVDEAHNLTESVRDAVMTNDYKKYKAFKELVGDLSIDWMQKIYQYYLADREDNKQDFTPVSLAKLVSKLVETDNEQFVLDVCSGSGALVIQKWNDNMDLIFKCQELDDEVIPYLLFNLAVRNINAIVFQTNVLTNEVTTIYDVSSGDEFSAVKRISGGGFTEIDSTISNPPFNISWDVPPFAELDNRFQYGVPPAGNANYVFIQHGLHYSKGKAAFILPNSVMTGNGVEQDIIKNLVEANQLEAVITCPPKMFESTSIPTCILLFNKNKDHDGVEFVDAKELFTEEVRLQNGQYGGASHTKRTYEKTINTFSDEQIQKILSVITERKDEEGFSKYATLEYIRANEYALTPGRYIEIIINHEHRPFKDIVNDINRNIDNRNMLKLTINETLAKNLGFDLDLYKENRFLDDDLNIVIEKLAGEKIKKSDYIRLTKNKNEFTFSNNSKDAISPVLMMMVQNWKLMTYHFNDEENRYLAELRDALLPKLMSGEIEL